MRSLHILSLATLALPADSENDDIWLEFSNWTTGVDAREAALWELGDAGVTDEELLSMERIEAARYILSVLNIGPY